MFVRILQALIILGASHAAAVAEMESSSAQYLAYGIGIFCAIFIFCRKDRMSAGAILPWVILSLTWFLPFLPGINSPYPPTRFLSILALGTFFARHVPASLRRVGLVSGSILVVWMGLLLARSWLFYSQYGYGYDLAHILNILHNTMEGQVLYSDYIKTSILSHHIFISLIALAPLQEISSWPFLPQLLQNLLMGASCFIIAAGMKRKWGDEAAAVSLFTFLLHPAFQGQTLHEFDPAVIGTIGVAIAFWGFAAEKRTLLYAGTLLAVISKETFIAGALPAGAFLVLKSGRRRDGAVITLLALGALTAYLALTRHYSETFTLATQANIRFGEQGLALEGLIGEGIRASKIGYLIHMLIPSGLVALMAPLWLIPALPEMLINVVSRFPMHKLSTHYSALSLPFLAIAAGVGSIKLRALVGKASPFLPGYIIACAIFAALLSNISPLSHTGQFYDVFIPAENPEADDLTWMLERLPAEGSIAVLGQHRALAFLAHREPVIPLPYLDMDTEIRQRDYLLLDGSPDTPADSYRLIESRGDIRLYEKLR